LITGCCPPPDPVGDVTYVQYMPFLKSEKFWIPKHTLPQEFRLRDCGSVPIFFFFTNSNTCFGPCKTIFRETYFSVYWGGGTRCVLISLSIIHVSKVAVGHPMRLVFTPNLCTKITYSVFHVFRHVRFVIICVILLLPLYKRVAGWPSWCQGKACLTRFLTSLSGSKHVAVSK
jgi:hypothetical protein